MKNVKDIIDFARECGDNNNVWLFNETFNDLAKKSVVSVNDKPELILMCDEEYEIRVSIKEEGLLAKDKSFVKVQQISKVAPYTRKKTVLFEAPEGNSVTTDVVL